MSFPRSSYSRKKFALPHVLLAVLLTLLTSNTARAQGVGSSRGLPGSGGIHTIQGKVYDPSGRPIQTQLRVSLESPNSSTQSTATDSDGAFLFRSLEAGEYRLTVNGGKEYENATEYPSIYRESSPGGRILQLTIQMRLKESLDPRFASVSNEAREFYRKGMEAVAAGDSKKAIDHLSKAVAAQQNFGPALTELGVQYLKAAQLEKAAEMLSAAIKLAPQEFYSRLNYGIVLLNQKKFESAEKELRSALQMNNSLPTAHMYLGLALMNQKKLEEAQTELETAVSSNNAEVGIAHKYLGGIYWGQRDYKRAIDELESYLKAVPKAPDAERTRAAIKELKVKL
jgi:regulator of sirC expression with transglutaminase-like and TPR domain